MVGGHWSCLILRGGSLNDLNECGEIYDKPLMDGVMNEHGGVRVK